jgi:hypothetical protein
VPVKAPLILTAAGIAVALLSFGRDPYTAAAEPAPVPESDVREYMALPAAETHPPLRLRPRKPQLVRLPREAGNIKVQEMSGRISAVSYGDKSIAIVPSNAGSAHITVTDSKGAVVMARYIIVVDDPAQKYIRIRQTCGQTPSEGCEKARVYYCPNLCYETHVVGAMPNQPTLKN